MRQEAIRKALEELRDIFMSLHNYATFYDATQDLEPDFALKPLDDQIDALEKHLIFLEENGIN